MTVVERKARLWGLNFITGIRRAREQGKHIGRPKSQIDQDLLVRFANSNGQERRLISQKCDVSLTTLYRRLNNFKERRNNV